MHLTGSNITVGLPIFNEETNLRVFFSYLKNSIEALDSNLNIETIACLNGCTDKSELVAKEIESSSLGQRINLRVIYSEKGKINAIIKIMEYRKNDGPICFFDSDTIVCKETIARLYNKLFENPNCYLSYSNCIPIYIESDNLSKFQRSQKSYYRYRENLPSKQYFHGRAYMLRDDQEIKNMAIENKKIKISSKLIHGIRVDDIYLSRAIYLKYGKDSMQEVSESKIFFHPPQTENELKLGILRTIYEINHINQIFPKFKEIELKLDRRELNEKLEIKTLNNIVNNEIKEYMLIEKKIWRNELNQLIDNKSKSLLKSEFDTTGWITLNTTKKAFPCEFNHFLD